MGDGDFLQLPFLQMYRESPINQVDLKVGGGYWAPMGGKESDLFFHEVTEIL